MDPVIDRTSPEESQHPAGAVAADAAADAAVAAAREKSLRWFRFWLRMLLVVVLFNVAAGLVTWYFIFPRLHPAH